MLFSCVIPVYNRPDELKDLLNSLLQQSHQSFEVLVVEDGSTLRCKEVVDAFADQLTIRYFFSKEYRSRLCP